MNDSIKYFITSLRPRQWIKNLFVFLALVFSLEFTDPYQVYSAVYAFILLSIVSSAVYLFNDIVDLKSDRAHPLKQKRPLASGQLSLSVAWISLIVLASIGLLGSFTKGYQFGLIILGFLILNVAYSLFLKRIPVVDVMAIAFGFVLRAIAGAVAISVQFSIWLVIVTFILTLYLAVSKRESELLLLGSGSHRSVLKFYSVTLFYWMKWVALLSTATLYVLYTFNSEHSLWLIVTIPPVMYGLFRYWTISNKKLSSNGDPTDILYLDRILQITMVVWTILTVGVLLLKF